MANYKSSLGKADFMFQTLPCSQIMAPSWPKNFIYFSSQWILSELLALVLLHFFPCFFLGEGKEAQSHFSSCDSAVYMPTPGIWTSLQRYHLQGRNCWESKDVCLSQLASLVPSTFLTQFISASTTHTFHSSRGHLILLELAIWGGWLYLSPPTDL